MSEDESGNLQPQYDKAVELLQSDSLQDVLQARELFKELGGYQDSKSYISKCSEKIASIRANKLLNKYSDEEPAKAKTEPAPQEAPKPTPQPEPQPAPAVERAPAAAAPKKKSNVSLIIAAVVLIAAVFAGGLAVGGFFNKDKTEDSGADEITTDTVGTDEVEEDNTVPETPEFAEANILSFDHLDLKNDPDLDDTKIAIYKITNKGKDVIWYLSVEFQYLDKDGNEVYQDGRFFKGNLEAGKSYYMESYSSDVDPDEIDSVAIKSYDYNIGQTKYMVNLQTKTVETEKEDNEWYSNVDFDKANILGMTLGEGRGDSDGNVDADIDVKNNGSNDLTYISIDVLFYSKNKDVLYTDGRYSDSLLKPGKSVRLTTYATSDTEYGKDMMDTFDVTSYDYTLKEKDKNGYNRYYVNLVTKTAYGEYESD